MVFRQMIGQSLEAGVVLEHVVARGNALLVASLHVILHRLLPTARTQFNPHLHTVHYHT